MSRSFATMTPLSTTARMGKIRTIHFIGIGGSGMSGIAELLHNIGYQVSGSDLNQSKTTDYLQSCQIKIFFGHKAENCIDADVVVRSTAIADDNIEIITANKKRIPIIRRAEMLAELMRFKHGIAVAGTHGKTTTTSLIASILAYADKDPTFVIGGKLNSAGTHAKLGAGPYLVAEADESDASFLHLKPMMSVVTNMEEDHMDTYQGDFNNLRNTFIEFIHQLPFYGLAIICLDDNNLCEMLEEFSRPVISYALTNSNADYLATDITQNGAKTKFRLTIKSEPEQHWYEINLPGEHNVLNAMAAIVVARELQIEHFIIQQALSEFGGIGRRFQSYGHRKIKGSNKAILLIDDYGHHPTELKATIKAVRSGWPGCRLLMIFQPHRYTRTRDLYDDFVCVLNEVDQLILLNVYPAGEKAISGADSRALARSVRNFGKMEPILVQDEEILMQVIQQQLRDNDIVLTIGAGSIGNLAGQLCDDIFEAV